MNRKTLLEEISKVHSIMYQLDEAKGKTAIRNVLKTALNSEAKKLINQLDKILPGGSGINQVSVLNKINNLDDTKKIEGKLGDIKTAISNAKTLLDGELAIQKTAKENLLKAGSDTKIVDDNIDLLTKTKTNLNKLEANFDSKVDALDRSRTKSTTTQKTTPEPDTQQPKPDPNTQQTPPDPNLQNALIGANINPPPANASPANKKVWLDSLLRAANIPLKLKLIGAMLVAGGVAGAIALVAKLFRDEGSDNEACFLFLQERHPNNIKFKKPTEGNFSAFSVKPTNSTALEIFPEGFTIVHGSKNREVYVSGRHIGSWETSKECDNLFVVKGTARYPIFKPQQKTNQPKTDGGGKFKPCNGTYGINCYSNNIKKLQQCLGGIKVDGYWGINTQNAVKNAGLPNILTDTQITNFCRKKQEPINPPNPTPIPQPSNDQGGVETDY